MSRYGRGMMHPAGGQVAYADEFMNPYGIAGSGYANSWTDFEHNNRGKYTRQEMRDAYYKRNYERLEPNYGEGLHGNGFLPALLAGSMEGGYPVAGYRRRNRAAGYGVAGDLRKRSRGGKKDKTGRWQKFLHEHGGKGYTRDELVDMYERKYGL
jgi:hypothetical protein